MSNVTTFVAKRSTRSAAPKRSVKKRPFGRLEMAASDAAAGCQRLSRQQLTALQTALNQRGFDSGAPDGVMGPTTRGAIRGYQRSVGLPADGYPTQDLLQRLLAQ